MPRSDSMRGQNRFLGFAKYSDRSMESRDGKDPRTRTRGAGPVTGGRPVRRPEGGSIMWTREPGPIRVPDFRDARPTPPEHEIPITGTFIPRHGERMHR
jgi:hypothetical protein